MSNDLEQIQSGKVGEVKEESQGGLDTPFTTFVTNQNVLQKDGFYHSTFIPGSDAALTTSYGHFFTAFWPCEVLAVIEVHSAVSSGANLDIRKDIPGATMGSGNSVIDTSFVTSSTANTPVVKSGNTLSATAANRRLNEGDRLTAKLLSSATGLENVCITVYFKYLGRGDYR